MKQQKQHFKGRFHRYGIALAVLLLVSVAMLPLSYAFASDSSFVWSNRTSTFDGTPNSTWPAVASNADGSKLLIGNVEGELLTSDNGGQTWTDHTSLFVDTGVSWSAAASNKNGNRLVAAAQWGDIWISADGGQTWTTHTTNIPDFDLYQWKGLASSNDGMKLTAVASSSDIWVSSDGGMTWSNRTTGTDASGLRWYSVASNADGSKLVACAWEGGIWSSVDGGTTWNQTSAPEGEWWQAITSSTDGTKLAAIAYGGKLFTSADGGQTWIDRAIHKDWSSIASDATGNRLAATTWENTDVGEIWTSEDGGATWNNRTEGTEASGQNWIRIVSSRDGSRLVAAEDHGDVWSGIDAALADDRDGIAAAVENAAPAGDGNGDGTPDAEQANVSSFINAVTGSYESVAVDHGCDLSGVGATDVAGQATDAGYSYPLGLTHFTAHCDTPGFSTTVKQYFYNCEADDYILRKLTNAIYSTVPSAAISMETINNQQVLSVTYSITDGGLLDEDLMINGTIVDPVGLAVSSTGGNSGGENGTPVPTDHGTTNENLEGTSIKAPNSGAANQVKGQLPRVLALGILFFAALIFGGVVRTRRRHLT